MATATLLDKVVGIPKLLLGQALYPLQKAMRAPLRQPKNQSELARLVNMTRIHDIRAGYSHRFIRLMFVTVGDRVFCRRYQYNEPSWHSVFLSDPVGQIRLDGVVANINAAVPTDMDEIIPAVDQAYADTLKKYGASFMLNGAIEERAQESTLELTFSTDPAES